jgi:hypothetical protein
LDGVKHRLTELAERFQDALPIAGVATIAGNHAHHRWAVRGLDERGIGGHFIGSRLDEIAEVPDDIDGGIARVEEKPTQDRVDLVGLELERRDYSEIPTPPRRVQKRSSFSEALAVIQIEI